MDFISQFIILWEAWVWGRAPWCPQRRVNTQFRLLSRQNNWSYTEVKRDTSCGQNEKQYNNANG